MKKIFTLLICSLLLYSCNKTQIIDLESKFLNQEELNNSKSLNKKIAFEYNQIKRANFRSGRDRFNVSGDSSIGKPMSDSDRKINEKIDKRIENYLAYSVVEIRKKYNDMKKYGLEYNFIFRNKRLETIEKINFKTVITYSYKNKTIEYIEKFEENRNLDSDDTLNIKHDYIFNFHPSFNPAYFEIHKPETITLKINATATNSIGFVDNSEAFLKIK